MGAEMFVWGGDGGDRFLNDGGRYDPAQDKWATLPATGVLSGRYAHTAVWTGTEVIVWGGQGCGTWPGAAGGPGPCGDGARYDPVSDSWTPVSRQGAPTARAGHTAVWSGRYMIVWGGFCEGGECAAGGLYDPASDKWLPVTAEGQPALRGDHGAVWTGDLMVVWGGLGGEYPIADLAAYTPPP